MPKKTNPGADRAVQTGRRRPGWFLVWAVLVGLAVVTGCGKKGPPIPPRPDAGQMKIVLAVGQSDGRADLEWRCAPCDPAVRSYAVYRSRTDAARPDCPGCPVVFEKVGQVTAAPGSQPLRLSADTAPGNHYRFKVVAVFKSGAQGATSNVVEIDTAP